MLDGQRLFQQLPFFVLGVVTPTAFLNKHRIGLKIAGLLGVFGLCVMLLLYSAEGKTLLQQGAVHLIRRALVFAVILGLAALCEQLEQTKIRSLFAKLGKGSMLWYLYHQPFCCAVLGAVLYDLLHLPILPVVCICFAASLLLPMILARCIRALHLTGLCSRLGLPF